MKLFRFAGLLVIAAALVTGSVKNAEASGPPYACYKWCSGILYDGTCTASLASCCLANRISCPPGTVYEGGDCQSDDPLEFCPY